MKRVFFAVLLPAPLLDRVVATVEALRRRSPSDGIRWSSREQVHVTLRYLGEQPDEQIEQALAAAREVASRAPPFELGLGTLGAFPSLERPRIVWLGIGAGGRELTHLASDLDASLGQRGFPREERPFVPHLTIARVKPRDDERATAHRLASAGASAGLAAPPPQARVDEFVLMQSETRREGARYTVVEALPLCGST